jgi:hypothetical protein
MLDTFGMAKGGKEYRRLVAAFERIFGATMFFGTEALNSRARVVLRSRFNFFREAQIWYDREQREQLLSDEFHNVIVLRMNSTPKSLITRFRPIWRLLRF